MLIITHRGLDAEGNNPYTESSREAFAYFLNQGFGIECDIQITKDSVPVISHDESLTRLVGKKVANIADITTDEFLATELPNGHPLTLHELIELIKETTNDSYIHAVHLKYHNQTKTQLDILMPYILEMVDLPVIIFDVKPDIAKKLKRQIPRLKLAASVSHTFDIERYNNVVGSTLLSLNEFLNYTDIYDWAWLDEWDRVDVAGGAKSLYNEKTFPLLRKEKIKIVVVSPELHTTSPRLLGGESHKDARDKLTLEKRWREIIRLAPDAICTDYPRSINQLVS